MCLCNAINAIPPYYLQEDDYREHGETTAEEEEGAGQDPESGRVEGGVHGSEDHRHERLGDTEEGVHLAQLVLGNQLGGDGAHSDKCGAVEDLHQAAEIHVPRQGGEGVDERGEDFGGAREDAHQGVVNVQLVREHSYAEDHSD